MNQGSEVQGSALQPRFLVDCLGKATQLPQARGFLAEVRLGLGPNLQLASVTSFCIYIASMFVIICFDRKYYAICILCG